MRVVPIIGICVPTIREDALHRFLHEWLPFWDAERTYKVRLFIHEDNAVPTFSVPPSTTLPYVHTSHVDIEQTLGSDAWIIPKRTAACRSFPMYLAWKDGCDFIVTMDDDCYPESGEGATFLARHVAAFTQDRWFRTIGGDEPRGIPYTRLGSLPVMVNHGLWTQTPDLDGPTSLVRHREPRQVHLPRGYNVVPPGMAFPLCAMNVCYRREAVPAAYNLLMGVTDYGFDRFDDIWSGLLLKRVLDYAGWYATSGDPVVTHHKASNPFANLRKEAGALEVHEHLWDFVLDAPLPPGLDLRGAYRALATRVRVFPDHVSAAAGLRDYFGRLADAMVVWVDLFEDERSATGADSFDRLHKQRTDAVE